MNQQNDQTDVPNEGIFLSRRTLLGCFFFGSVAAAGSALIYRAEQIAQFTRAAWPSSAEATVHQSTTPTPSATVAGKTATVAPSTVRTTPVPPSTEQPILTQPGPDPIVAETGIPAMQEPAPKPTAAPVALATPAIVSRQEWGARPPAYDYIAQNPVRLTLHHEGMYFDGSVPAATYIRRVQNWSIENRGWPDIPYHFIIDLAGIIYEGRPVTARGDTNTAYDLQGHVHVSVLGKYDRGEQEPNEDQITAVVHIMAWIISRYGIPIETIKGHRDFIPVNASGEHIDPRTGSRITCPGDNLYRYLADGTIQTRIAGLLER